MFKPIYLLGTILSIVIYWFGSAENVVTSNTHLISNTEGSLPKVNSTTSSASEKMLTIIYDAGFDSNYLDAAFYNTCSDEGDLFCSFSPSLTGGFKTFPCESEGKNDHVLKAHKNDQCLEGVSTLDLVLIQRHLLNQEKLQGPLKLLAADVNSSGKVTTTDLVELRKLILGISDFFKDSDCWLYIDKNYVFEDPKSPWDHPKGQDLNSLDIDLPSSDLTAVKLGDVNGSVSKIQETYSVNRNPKIMEIFTSDIVFEEGEEIEVPIYTESQVELLALQANFSFSTNDLEFIGLEGNQIDIIPEIYHSFLEDNLGHVTIAYSNHESVEIDAIKPLFNFVFVAKNRGRLSNVFTENSTKLQGVAYDTKYEQVYLDFRFDEENLSTIELGVPSPNPFIGQTQIDLAVATSSYVELELFNQSGSKLYSNGAFFPAGRHKLEITNEMLSDNKGVLYLHVSGPESHSVIKLIRIE